MFLTFEGVFIKMAGFPFFGGVRFQFTLTDIFFESRITINFIFLFFARSGGLKLMRDFGAVSCDLALKLPF